VYVCTIIKTNDMKTQHFNRIKRALENEANQVKHLPALRNMVDNFETNFGTSNLSNALLIKYFNKYLELNLCI